jgi:hypothetical protein
MNVNWFPSSLWQKWRTSKASKPGVIDACVAGGQEAQEAHYRAFCARQGLKEPVSNWGRGYLESGYLFCEWMQDQGLLCHRELNPASIGGMLRHAKKRAEHAFARCGASMSLPMLAVAFPNQQLLWAATESLVGESYGPSQARFFSGPFPHLFAAFIGVRDERVLVHEFTHAIFSRNRLPQWLDEGLALLAEEAIFGAPEILNDAIELKQLDIDEPTIDQFFDGALFDTTDLQFRRLAYWYAFVVVRSLYGANPGAFGEGLSQHTLDPDWDLWLKKNFGLTRDKIAADMLRGNNPGHTTDSS